MWNLRQYCTNIWSFSEMLWLFIFIYLFNAEDVKMASCKVTYQRAQSIKTNF